MEWIPIVFVTFKLLVLGTGMFFAVKWHYDQDQKKKNEASGMRLFSTMIIALALSLIGIVYAGCWGHSADGGYGGALGCAFTFFMAFMSKPAGHAQGDVLAEPGPTTLNEGHDQLARLKVQTEQVRAAFLLMLNSAERDKVYLSVASLISTLAWKFGDVAAALLNSRH